MGERKQKIDSTNIDKNEGNNHVYFGYYLGIEKGRMTNEILSLIPQRPPFVMVDALVSADDTSATTSYKVPADNLFLENGVLTESALIENIAQTAAARMGYLCQQKKEPVPLGFIGAVQKLKVNQLPLVADELSTTITIKNQVFDVTIISGKIEIGSELYAECEMKIFINNS